VDELSSSPDDDSDTSQAGLEAKQEGLLVEAEGPAEDLVAGVGGFAEDCTPGEKVTDLPLLTALGVRSSEELIGGGGAGTISRKFSVISGVLSSSKESVEGEQSGTARCFCQEW
jgi:hypothetical protein